MVDFLRRNVMELNKLTGKQISLKLKTQETAFNCTIKYVVESRGFWVTGAPILQHVVQSGGSKAPMQNAAILVFFENVEWILADLK
jgi:hypothetical protein